MRTFLYFILFLALISGVGLMLKEIRQPAPPFLKDGSVEKITETIKQKAKETTQQVKDAVEVIVQEPKNTREDEPDDIQEEALAKKDTAESGEIFSELDAEFAAETEMAEKIVPQNNEKKLTTEQALAIIRALKEEKNENR